MFFVAIHGHLHFFNGMCRGNRREGTQSMLAIVFRTKCVINSVSSISALNGVVIFNKMLLHSYLLLVVSQRHMLKIIGLKIS